MNPKPVFRVGDRVRYLYTHRMSGTIVKPCHRGGDWYVRWDEDPHGPRLLSAYEENIELLARPEAAPR